MAENIERFGAAFAPRDKVMQIENDYGRRVFSGAPGRVRRIGQTEGVLIAEFDNREGDIRSANSMRSFPLMRQQSTNPPQGAVCASTAAKRRRLRSFSL
ncbi:MAG: hypothetical protein M3Z96_05250 [Pseudomonadota bacterium]|nr:hypothetical protein [Pseudomonadota bacterium]